MRQKPNTPSAHHSQAPWLILFDGICRWCTGWVQFLITRDTGKRFQFAPLQSPLGQQQLASYHFSPDTFSTFVVITPQGHFIKSTAVLQILRRLGGLWYIAYAFILVPRFLRDGIYDLVARHRFQLRGTLATCYRPPEEFQDRFLYDI